MSRVFIAGATIVLPDRLETGRTLVIENGRIADFAVGPRRVSGGDVRVTLPGSFVLPGFVDVHVHGLGGHDTLDGPAALDAMAAGLPCYGVTAFCPTTVACSPESLSGFLRDVAERRRLPRPEASARMLGAHLESNFLNPEYRGAQPAGWLCLPPRQHGRGAGSSGGTMADEVLDVIERHRPDIATVTLAPELPGGLELVRRLRAWNLRVAAGHSGATFDEATAAIDAGVQHATHLFNRMPPMTHRAPGLAAAVLASEAVAAELIGDGHHVHPAFVQMTVAAKGVSRVMAITDGTAGSGLPAGSRARLGGRAITVAEVARLDDGTSAGSVATMDGVFRHLVGGCGIDIREAAHLCSTTPAREMGLVGFGAISAGNVADLVVLDGRFNVVQTWIAGALVFRGTSPQLQPSSST